MCGAGRWDGDDGGGHRLVRLGQGRTRVAYRMEITGEGAAEAGPQIGRDIATALAPLDPTHVQFVLPACTWWPNGRGGRPDRQAVARQAGTNGKTTSRVLRTPEKKGLVEREVDPADTRAERLRVTGPAPNRPPCDRRRRGGRRAVLRAGPGRGRGGPARPPGRGRRGAA
ncbi:hypothetical protein ACFVFI_07245 [Streptomyces sp. NPDC057705]|uniref:hypothetical protein n=1 Tax=Streptomyces sp. NPDC057705 TaxID=3346222 RepID=UPI0036CFACC3